MTIERITPDHPLWDKTCTHLKKHGMARAVLHDNSYALPAIYILCAVNVNDIIGHISLKMQRMSIPISNGSSNGSEDTLLEIAGPEDRPLRELFVQSFAVDAEFRRQGYGRELQECALNWGRRLHCYQLRSWSSVDKHANYALKLSMGFAAHPAIQPTASGEQISGVYFVKTV